MSELGDPRKESQLLHSRILAGDITAQVELAEIALPLLTMQLTKRFPNIYDPDLIDSAVTDALIDYFGNPENYQENKRSLLGYLLMAARGDLLNSLKSRKVDENSINLSDFVELDNDDVEYKLGDFVFIDSALPEEEAFLRLSPLNSEIKRLLPDPVDQELANLMLAGVRETEEYSKVLGIARLDYSIQKETVKKHKDRIKKVFMRHIDPKGLKNDY